MCTDCNMTPEELHSMDAIVQVFSKSNVLPLIFLYDFLDCIYCDHVFAPNVGAPKYLREYVRPDPKMP